MLVVSQKDDAPDNTTHMKPNIIQYHPLRAPRVVCLIRCPIFMPCFITAFCAVLQYTAPFSSVDLNKMAAAFNTTVG